MSDSLDSKPARTSKRLFIGFPIEADSSLEAAMKRTRITSERKGMEFYWTPPANYHVTLCFLGATELGRIPELEEILRETAAAHPPFHTKLRGMGGFPNERHVRALFVGVRKSRSLAILQGALSDALAAHGFHSEDRDYIPHLTVGRLRKSRNVVDLISPYVRTNFSNREVSEIVLFESVVHGGHPVYLPLSRYPLTGAPHTFEDDDAVLTREGQEAE